MNPIHAKVLIVGNSAAMRYHLRSTLNELTVNQIDEANDGRTAFTLHQSGRYDLVVSEWDLQGLSGIELLRLIRRGVIRAQTLVVLLTAKEVGSRTVVALQAGANGLVELPLDTRRTREKLSRLIASLPESPGRGEVRSADLWSPSLG